MYRLYMAETGRDAPYRVRHAVKTLNRALSIGRTLIAAYVEVREFLPTGRERLVGIIQEGRELFL